MVQFVTDGIESAVAQARSAAGQKSVAVHGAETIQECLDAGLLDEIHIDLAAVLQAQECGCSITSRTHRPSSESDGRYGRGCHASALSRARVVRH